MLKIKDDAKEANSQTFTKKKISLKSENMKFSLVVTPYICVRPFIHRPQASVVICSTTYPRNTSTFDNAILFLWKSLLLPRQENGAPSKI